MTELNTLLTTLFERYSDLLRRKFSTDFDQVSTLFSNALQRHTSIGLTEQIIQEDDNQPMAVNDQEEFDQVVGVCWLPTGEMEMLAMYVNHSAGQATLLVLSDRH